MGWGGIPYPPSRSGRLTGVSIRTNPNPNPGSDRYPLVMVALEVTTKAQPCLPQAHSSNHPQPHCPLPPTPHSPRTPLLGPSHPRTTHAQGPPIPPLPPTSPALQQVPISHDGPRGHHQGPALPSQVPEGGVCAGPPRGARAAALPLPPLQPLWVWACGAGHFQFGPLPTPVGVGLLIWGLGNWATLNPE